MMFKCSTCIGVLSSQVYALFQYSSVIHTHNICNEKSNFIHTLVGRSETTYRTFSYRGAHIWNISLKCFIGLF